MTNGTALAVVDGHVHLHACHERSQFLDAAFANLNEAARRDGTTGTIVPYLLLTECRGDDEFAKLAALAASDRRERDGSWGFSATDEPVSLIATSGGGRMVIVAGRQVACREGLEVLMLGTRQTFDDGRPIGEVLEAAAAANIMHVIPWGPGKWFFRRGKLLNQLLRRHRTPLFFLGDEGGRPVFWRYPLHFAEALAAGVSDLPGTDPLPFAWDIAKVGRMGSIVPITLDPRRPWHQLQAALVDGRAAVRRFATLESPVMFVVNQFAMQLRKHRRN